MAVLDLCTVEDLLSYPGMEDMSDNDKLWALQMIRGFAQRASKFVGREFYKESRTRQFGSNGHNADIQLPAFGASTNSITSVHESLDRTFTSSTLLDSDDYYFDWETGVLHREYSLWLSGRGTVQVIWVGGWGTDVDTVPDDVRTAGVMQIAFWYQRRFDLGLTGRAGGQGASVDILVPSKLLPEVEETLSAYRLPY